MRDYAGNKRFRRDLFARCTTAMTAIVGPYPVTQSLRVTVLATISGIASFLHRRRLVIAILLPNFLLLPGWVLGH